MNEQERQKRYKKFERYQDKSIDQVKQYLLKKFKCFRGRGIDTVIDEYLQLPLPVPFQSRESVQLHRACQALTNCGFTIFSASDGQHDQRFPAIFFYCAKEPAKRVPALELIIGHERDGLIADKTNYAWHTRVEGHGLSIPAFRGPPYRGVRINKYHIPFELAPVAFWEKVTSIDYDKILEDLDIIGIGVLYGFKDPENTEYFFNST